MPPDPKSFELANADPTCKITLPHNLTQEQLLNFTAFKNWIKALQHALALQNEGTHTFHACRYKLHSIDVESATWFTSKMLGFVKLQADIKNDEGGKLPGTVFLRGGSVAMLVSISTVDIVEPPLNK
jgi:ADP-sugar diphosphatase